MIEQRIFEYFVNSLWQLPLLVLAVWLVVRIARPNVVAQHALWLGTLALGVVIPLRGIDSVQSATISTVASSSQYAPDALSQIIPSTSVLPVTASPHGQNLWSMATLRFHPIHLESRTMNWLMGLYGVSIALGMVRLVHGWLAAERLVANAMEHPLTMLESSLLRACADRIGIPQSRIPRVRFLADCSVSPMVVGTRSPALLLPESLRHRSDAVFNDQALTAVMLHELAHIRRRDYLTNLLARVAALPIAYHPATQALHARIRQTREMICDAAAAEALASNSSYARSLLTLAKGIVNSPQPVEAVGLFDHTRNSLEERIMKLTEPKLPLSLALRAARIAAGIAILVAGTGATSMLHIRATVPVVYAMQTPQAAPRPPAVPTAPEPPTPTPSPTPAPEPTPVPEVHVKIQAPRTLTQQERSEIEEQVKVEHDQIHTMTQDLKLNVPITIPPIDLKNFPGPEFDQQMAKLKEQMNSPEFRKQMDEMRDKLNSPEFRKQIADAASKANRDVMNSPEFKKQMEEIHRQVNSPEFRARIERSKKLAMEARADAAQHSAEARKQLAEASAAIAEASKQVHDEAVQRQLDEAQRRIDKAAKTY